MAEMKNGKRLNPVGQGALLTDRGFAYGDGVFETMYWEKGTLRFAERHLTRFIAGLQTLGIHLETPLDASTLSAHCAELIGPPFENAHRLKLFGVRRTGGHFIPSEEIGDWYLMATPLETTPRLPKRMGISERVRLYPSPTAQFKTLSSLPYVLAGLEANERGLDDLVLLDQHGHVGEGIVSNLFWGTGHRLLTPALDCSCVAGVARAALLEGWLPPHYKVAEISELPLEALLDAEYAFTSNSLGLQPIGEIDGKQFRPVPPEILAAL